MVNQLEIIEVFNTKLDKSCEDCAKGWSGPNGMCSKCNNGGYILTDAGKAVLDFIMRHSVKCS